MVRIRSDMPPGVLGLEAVGDVERGDYERVILPSIESSLAEHGKVRLVYVLGPEFADYEGEAGWGGPQVGGQHPRGFARVATVSDAGWGRPAGERFCVAVPRPGEAVIG